MFKNPCFTGLAKTYIKGNFCYYIHLSITFFSLQGKQCFALSLISQYITLLGYCYLQSALGAPTALQTLEVTAQALNKMQHLMRGMAAQDDSKQKRNRIKNMHQNSERGDIL